MDQDSILSRIEISDCALHSEVCNVCYGLPYVERPIIVKSDDLEVTMSVNPYLDCKHVTYLDAACGCRWPESGYLPGRGAADSASVYNDYAIDKVNTQLDQACWSIVD
jgi:hypothetical protein